MLTWGVLKNVSQVVQRVVFLHEDLMKLPSFPRKALEAELDLYANGEMGKVAVIDKNIARCAQHQYQEYFSLRERKEETLKKCWRRK